MEIINGNTILMSLVFLATLCFLGYATQEVEEEAVFSKETRKYCWGSGVFVMCSNEDMGIDLAEYWNRYIVSMMLVDLDDVMIEIGKKGYEEIIEEKIEIIKNFNDPVIFYGRNEDDFMWFVRYMNSCGKQYAYTKNQYVDKEIRIAYNSIVLNDSKYDGYDFMHNL